MASVGGSKVIQEASYTVFEFICAPCKNDNLEKEANHYCEDCSEYLCHDCKHFHQKVTVTKNHKILSGSEMPKEVTRQPKIYCGCSQNWEVQRYCQDHDEVICNACESMKHRRCITISLDEGSVNYIPDMFNAVFEKSQLVQDKLKEFKKKCTQDKAELDKLKESVVIQIRTFRKELDDFLDRLEQDILDDLKLYVEEHRQHIEKHCTAVENVLDILKSDLRKLKDIDINDCQTPKLFAVDKQVSNDLIESEALLKETKADSIVPFTTLVKNRKISELQTKVKSLGYLKRFDKRVNTDLKIKSSKQIDLADSSDKTESEFSISGLMFMPDGNLLVSFIDKDADAGIMKLFDHEWKEQAQKEFQTRITFGSVVNESEVLICLPKKMQLQYIQVYPTTEDGEVIQLDKACFTVEVVGDEMFACFLDTKIEEKDKSEEDEEESEEADSKKGKGEVCILDMNGYTKSQIGLNTDGSFVFKEPLFLAINPVRKTVFVLDNGKSIFRLTMEGDIISQFEGETFTGNGGFIVDAENNFTICDNNSSTVLKITDDGKKHVTLIGDDYNLDGPVRIAYNECDKTLVIACVEPNNVIHVFDMQQ